MSVSSLHVLKLTQISPFADLVLYVDNRCCSLSEDCTPPTLNLLRLAYEGVIFGQIQFIIDNPVYIREFLHM